MDILDRAQHTEDMHRAAAVTQARAALGTGSGREYCLHCEEPIPKARRKALPGCRLCINCQRELENERA